MHEVYGPYIRARLGTAAHFCEVVTFAHRDLRQAQIVERVVVLVIVPAVRAESLQGYLAHKKQPPQSS